MSVEKSIACTSFKGETFYNSYKSNRAIYLSRWLEGTLVKRFFRANEDERQIKSHDLPSEYEQCQKQNPRCATQVKVASEPSL